MSEFTEFMQKVGEERDAIITGIMERSADSAVMMCALSEVWAAAIKSVNPQIAIYAQDAILEAIKQQKPAEAKLH